MRLEDIKPGNGVIRMMAGMPMRLIVSEVTDNLIKCGPWEFSRRTGAEVDEDLGWGEHRTGSYLLHDELGKSVVIEQEGDV